MLTGDDKAASIRARIARAERETGRELAVRRSPNGFYVGLMTPGRRRGTRRTGKGEADA